MNTTILKLYTARLGHYSGPGALDITRDTADRYPDALGTVFAPPRWLLSVAMGIPSAAAYARVVIGTQPPSRRNAREFVGWYERHYRNEMEPVLQPQTARGREGLPSPALDALFSFADDLERVENPESDGSVTLLCFCENAAACHRAMLARQLEELWPDRVSYEGERVRGERANAGAETGAEPGASEQ